MAAIGSYHSISAYEGFGAGASSSYPFTFGAVISITCAFLPTALSFAFLTERFLLAAEVRTAGRNAYHPYQPTPREWERFKMSSDRFMAQILFSAT